MIIDSSALIAIVFDESDGPLFVSAIVKSERRLVSAANWLEAAIVVENRGDSVATQRFDDLVGRLKIEIVGLSAEQAVLARAAYQRFGKGRHKARLNFGDCFAYALAASTGDALLFKGQDFVHTDIAPAMH